MANNDYQTLMMTYSMLRDFQQQCKQQEAESSAENKQPKYQRFQDEVLEYPIFSNHACGNLDAKELLAAGTEESYLRRWRFFYAPEPEKMPQNDYQQEMEEQLLALEQRQRALNSPRLTLFAVTFVLIIFLVMRGHFLLPILPIGALTWYWYVSELKARQVQAQLRRHYTEVNGLLAQRDTMAQRLGSLPPPADLEHFAQHYREAIERLLRNTLLHVLAPDELGNLPHSLKNQHWEGFMTESWGYLQLPLPAQANTDSNRMLLDESHIMLSALQDDPLGRKGFSVFRLQYLHLWILTQRGLLMGRAYYDRVANRFLHEEHEFYPYPQLAHIHLAEHPLPEMEQLKQRLPEYLYQRYFQQPVTVLSVGTSDGKVHECASLPVSERPFRQKVWKEGYGLDSDMQRLNRCLHERLYRTNPAVA
jgi:hypothetical protein